MTRVRRPVALPDVFGLAPFPCETALTGDPYLCVVRVWGCLGYAACLDLACAENWRSFSCRACPVYARYFDDTDHVRIVRKVLVEL